MMLQGRPESMLSRLRIRSAWQSLSIISNCLEKINYESVRRQVEIPLVSPVLSNGINLQSSTVSPRSWISINRQCLVAATHAHTWKRQLCRLLSIWGKTIDALYDLPWKTVRVASKRRILLSIARDTQWTFRLRVILKGPRSLRNLTPLPLQLFFFLPPWLGRNTNKLVNHITKMTLFNSLREHLWFYLFESPWISTLCTYIPVAQTLNYAAKVIWSKRPLVP